MKLINTEEAIGHVLCHDITRIIPGEEKGPVFRKGHIVTREDIPVLLSVGKEHLYVWEKTEGMLHEDEAAEILREICMGEDTSMTASAPSEGKIEIRAARDGLLKIDREKLLRVNSLGEMMIASIHGDQPVGAGTKLAGTRVIPLVIEKEKMERAKEAAGGSPIFSILPFSHIRYGLVTTGNEVAAGRIRDAFGPVLKKKMAEYDTECLGQVILPDDKEAITKAILKFVREGADLVLCSGGMSVDPDDKTPGAIRDTGAEVVSYGAPVLPGAMFLLAYLKTEAASGDNPAAEAASGDNPAAEAASGDNPAADAALGDNLPAEAALVKNPAAEAASGSEHVHTVPVLGIPGCVMYAKRTVFDLVLPRILAGEHLTAADLARYGEGGLCLNCEVCHFPNCCFGK
ncbi:MAG: molybdopterin-binding protein [Eubacterium sp.]|nr:molybdopterin-binding protein [Eubacterium sp.]